MKVLKIISIFLLLLLNKNIFGQGKTEENLTQAFLDLNMEKIHADEIALNITSQNFAKQLIYILENDDISTFKTFRKAVDSLNADFTIKKSATGNYELFTLRNDFSHWNYILKNKKVVHKSERVSDYFFEIYELTNNNVKEYLLIKRMDEMSFSCYEAYVFLEDTGYESGKNSYQPVGNKVLTVCSWTNVDESYPGDIEGKMVHYKPIKIEFNPKNNTISYVFHRQKDGKKIKRKAKYKNGKFNIKNYDARIFEE